MARAMGMSIACVPVAERTMRKTKRRSTSRRKKKRSLAKKPKPYVSTRKMMSSTTSVARPVVWSGTCPFATLHRLHAVMAQLNENAVKTVPPYTFLLPNSMSPARS